MRASSTVSLVSILPCVFGRRVDDLGTDRKTIPGTGQQGIVAFMFLAVYLQRKWSNEENRDCHLL